MKSCLLYMHVWGNCYYTAFWFGVRVCTSSLSWPKSRPFIQCDIHFLPAERRHFDFSLHPHILTFCKHVWLYVLTLLPSGCFAQALFRHAALTERSHGDVPVTFSESHNIIIVGGFSLKGLCWPLLPLSVTLDPYSALWSSCLYSLWSAEVWTVILNYTVW